MCGPQKVSWRAPGHFADHIAEDIIEQIACQFTAKHIRGRPRPPYWYPSWPLYVCDSRYNDRERVFVKIKNWNSCIPEDYRKNDFMPVYPFERIIYPKRHPSPFLSGITGPGGIGDSIERAEGEKIEGGGTGRKRARKNTAGHTDHAGPRYGTFVGTPSGRAGSAGAQPAHQPQPPVPPQQKRAEDRSIGTAAGGLANLQGSAVVEVLPAETGESQSTFLNDLY
jgi:chromatin structure-remodeling complex subunit RSC1/2